MTAKLWGDNFVGFDFSGLVFRNCVRRDIHNQFKVVATHVVYIYLI